MHRYLVSLYFLFSVIRCTMTKFSLIDSVINWLCLKYEYGVNARSRHIKTWRPTWIGKICCWIHILPWIYRSRIVFSKALVLDGSLQYVQCAPYSAILQIFLLFSMIRYCLIQSSAVSKRLELRWCRFSDRFRYQLTTFEIRVSIGLSRRLHTRIAYEIDTSKIIAAFCRLFCCLCDLIRLNSIACRVQRARCTMMRFSLIDSTINWLFLEFVYW